ncbi:MAG TPA: hypothetical protein DDZ81_19675 [Acetobacteraceae bacterium]|jgi:hypothetical protein|nr:hypothetical protein [Acetobacteraceae bacterium]
MTVETAMQAGSYADLLKPIPNAVALLAAVRPGPVPEGRPLTEEVQYHHHHDNYYRGGYYGGYYR